MKSERSISEWKELIEKYFAAGTSLEEEQALYAYFKHEAIEPELEVYRSSFKPFAEDFKQLQPSEEMIQRIISAHPTEIENKKYLIRPLKRSYIMIAASIGVLFLTFAAGYFSGSQQYSFQAQQQLETQHLQEELLSIKKLMVHHFLDQKQRHQKLYALTLAAQLDEIEDDMLEKVFSNLKHDQNVNIRLAATEILHRFSDDVSVQEGIIHAFPEQESPLVMLELLRIIKSLDEAQAADLLSRILGQETMKDSLRNQIMQMYEAI